MAVGSVTHMKKPAPVVRSGLSCKAAVYAGRLIA